MDKVSIVGMFVFASVVLIPVVGIVSGVIANRRLRRSVLNVSGVDQLEMKEGDVLVVSFEDYLTQSAFTRMQENFKNILRPGTRVVVLEKGKLSVISNSGSAERMMTLIENTEKMICCCKEAMHGLFDSHRMMGPKEARLIIAVEKTEEVIKKIKTERQG